MKKFSEMSKTKKTILISTACVAGALLFAGAGYGLAKVSSSGIIATIRHESQQQAASQNQTAGQNQQGELIGLEAAKAAALADAGLSASDVTFTKEKQDRDNGVTVYDLEFYNASTKYDYEINAVTGAVLERSSEVFQNNGGQNNSQSSGQSQNSGLIGLEAAREIALKDAGLSASDVTFTKEKQDRDDGRIYYEFEFFTSDREYDYEIHGTTGAIVDKSIEGFHHGGNQTGGTDIGVDQAKTIALNHAGLSASDVNFAKAKLENDDGRIVYEVEFYHGNREYDYTIDAYSGAILEYDADWDD